jgi:hypothetical protein
MASQRSSDSVSIHRLRNAILKLPPDPDVLRPGIWYLNQRQHWLNWLKYYHTPGAYKRQVDTRRDARYAYNHVVNPDMLLWLVDASGVERARVRAARKAVKAVEDRYLMRQAAAVRKEAPWELVHSALREKNLL